MDFPLSFEDYLIHEIQKVNEAERIEFIKQEELHIKKINDFGETLLHFGAKNGYVDIIKLLIAAGSDVNIQDNNGKTPIIVVVESKPRYYMLIIEILFAANAHIHITDKRGKHAAQLVFDDSSFSSDFILKFYFHLVYFECKNNFKMTAEALFSLGYSVSDAVLLGDPSVVDHIIKLGGGVNNTNDNQPILAVSRAVQRMDLEIFKVLINHNASVDIEDSSGKLPIAYYGTHVADIAQQPEIIKFLLTKSLQLQDLEQRNIIYQFKNVFEYGNKEVIQMLIDHHKDILNIRDRERKTALHYLSRNFHSNVTEVLESRAIDVNVIDARGRTPLFIAAESAYTHINTFKFLLKKGATVNACTLTIVGHEVPLFTLCRNGSISKIKYLEILEIFLEYDLNVQFVGSNGLTVFDIIMQRNLVYFAEPILRHIAILDELKMLIVEHIRSKIDSVEIFKKYFDTCKAELSGMKKEMVSDKLTLYTIVTKNISDEQILKKCRFGFNSLSNLEKFKEMFLQNHCYYSTVQNRVSRIVSKLTLWRKAVISLCDILKFTSNPYHIALVEITDYLADEDLNNLIKVTM